MTDNAADGTAPLPAGGRLRQAGMAALLLIAIALGTMAVAVGAGRPATTDTAAFGAVSVVEVFAYASFVAVSAILLLRRPGHPIGGLFAVVGIGLLVDVAAREYVVATLPGWPVAVWVSAWIFAPTLTTLIAVVLLFPTGHATTRFSRWMLRTIVIAGGLLTIGWAVASWPQRHTPLGWILPSQGWPALLPPVATALVACLVLAAAMLVLRYRRVASQERLQLKWLAVAAFGLGLAALVGLTAELLGRGPVTAVELVGTLSIAGIPVAVTLAILRYRLYEIDRIISRTLAYTLLTGMLGAVYAVGVLLLSGPTLPFRVDSDVAVATSTLTVAALFDPLRRRLQTGVDRHFNRSAYDAALVIEHFAARLRSATELDDVLSDLTQAVQTAVPVRRIRIWLRPTAVSPYPQYTPRLAKGSSDDR